MTSKTLLIIDGHSLAFRAFYALPPESFRTASGVYTNAVHGFLQMLLSLLEKEAPTHAAVAFDLGRESFRTVEYPDYKGTRGETPPEFLGQTDSLQRALQAMRIVTLTKTDYEADDILATLATRGAHEGFRVLVVSGDRDTIQLIDDDVTLLYPVKGVQVLTRYDAETVKAKYDVFPWQYQDLAALVGETSDNLPGVPSVGPKTAAKWINAYGSLSEILARQDDLSGKVGESFREHAQNAVRNRRLNQLVRDLDLGVGLDELALTEIDRPRVDEVFAELELRTVGARVRQLGPGLRKSASPVHVDGQADRPPTLASTTPAVPPSAPADARPTGVVEAEPPAPESRDERAMANWLSGLDGVVGVSFDVTHSHVSLGVATVDAVADWSGPLDQFQQGPLAAWVRSDSPKVIHAAKEAYRLAWEHGFDIGGVVADSSLTWFIADSTRPAYSLEKAVEQFFTAELAQSDPSQLVPETEPASQGTRAWFARQLHELLDAGLLPDARETILQGIEVPLARVLAAMEAVGVAVDKPGLEQVSGELGTRMADIAAQAFASIGREVNLASPKQLQEVLFDELGLPKTRKLKTGYSTDAESLADLVLKTEHEFPVFLLQHRDVTKLRQMVDTLIKFVEDDGRIHTRYSQTGAATGRLSSADPNLQNIPVKTDEGKRIRSLFVAGTGYTDLLTADYSQVEMRIMAHMSGDEGLIEAFRSGEDLHRFVGARVFGVEPDDVTPAMRSKVKAMSYGLVYGLSAFGLARQLRIPQREAQDLMSGYFQRFGGVRDYLREVVAEARERGFTTTLFGRRRLFPDLASSNRVLRDNAERAALNAPIQGTAADIMKIAMLAVDQALRESDLRSRMLLQVHDELIFDVADGEHDALEEIVTTAMSGAASLDVPLEVQVGFGPNWNVAAH